MACWLLRQLPAYASAEIVRSRDPAILKELDIIVDVGNVYDAATFRFDHHQRGFFEVMDSEPGSVASVESVTGRWKTKLSSAGLVYKHFGQEIIERFAETDSETSKLIWEEVYDRLIESVDAIDNGIGISDGSMKFKDLSGLASRVARLNPRWNETSDEEDQSQRFETASALCGAEFLDVLGDVVEGWLPARAKIKDALRKRREVHPSGQILWLESGGLPWKGHVYTLERESGIEGELKFVLYPDGTGMWRLQAISVEHRPFTNRVSLPEPWCGLREDALVQASGIPGSIFVHANGFIGGNETFEGVLAMASESLKRSLASES
eukprot:TRINITY_DN3018_c1_g1_i1.p1 TRINITY_DN3018_c1_g1~~TRINITY_DN3018_c1_g1_i1.p1  ORF type:complete len:348 (+),score=72.15 TRINITY_DN3018_c1_g1_i1:77-1045(+)